MGFTKPTEPIIHLDVDGQSFELAFDFETVAIAEDMTGRAILTGLTREVATAPAINFVRALLYACLLKHQPKITYPEARALVKRDNLATVWTAVVDAYLSTCDVADDEKEDGADPTPDQS